MADFFTSWYKVSELEILEISRRDQCIKENGPVLGTFLHLALSMCVSSIVVTLMVIVNSLLRKLHSVGPLFSGFCFGLVCILCE